MALRFAHLQFTTTRSEMKVSSFLRGATTALFIAASALLPVSANAQSAPAGGLAEKWMFTATLYGWVPTIDGKVNFAEDRGSTGIHASMSDVLTHLRMTFQGTLDAHNGRWGMFTDVVYVDVAGVKSNERDFSIGNIGIPATATADLDLTIKALVWTVAGEYRVASDPAWTVDVLGGARLLQMKPRLGYSITGDIGGIVLPGRRKRLGRDRRSQGPLHFWGRSQVVRAVLPRCRYRTNATDVADCWRNRLFLQLGFCLRDVAVS
jgi:hypothetical protein